MKAWFDFIRRERLYFLVLLLTLAVMAFNLDLSPSTSTISPETDQMAKSVQDWEKSLQNVTTLIDVFLERPAAATACGLILVIFAGLFFGGIFLLVAISLIPSIQTWFESARPRLPEPRWNGVIFFRVLILIFASIVISGVVAASLWPENSQNENFIGLFHTLVIDLLAAFSIFAVISDEGISWNFFLTRPEAGYSQEIKRGLAGYAVFFPVFVAALFLAIGIAGWLHYEPPLHPLVKIFVEEEHRSQFVFHFALILAAIAAPILEEIFFRGFCYRLFRSWWGARGAAGISAALFAGMHGSGFAFFPIFVLGLALAWLYEKRGNLTACWTFHVLHNILFTGYFFAVKALLGVKG